MTTTTPVLVGKNTGFILLLTTLLILGSFVVVVEARKRRPPRSHELTDSYDFATYTTDFDKEYDDDDDDDDEWETRRAVFEENLSVILAHNRRYYGGTQEGDDDDVPTYTMGVNHLTDRRPDELPLGYHRRSQRHGHRDDGTTSSFSRRLQHKQGELPLPFKNDPVSMLPEHVDWSDKSTPVKNQGHCGSCWAFSTVEIVETHTAIHTGESVALAPQELLSCMKNPEECGGEGGCDGSDPMIALAYVAANGIRTEQQMPYTAMDGVCPREKEETLWGRRFHSRRSKKTNKTSTASVQGYAGWHNDYETLMNAVAKAGPVAVGIAAGGILLYEGGVFSNKDYHHEQQDPNKYVINHSVVVEGYGTDEKSGEDYWLVRNSWGPMFGEKGYIRIKRGNGDGDDCWDDAIPLDGNACRLNPDGSVIEDEAFRACGSLGILTDNAMPIGAHLIH